MSFNLLCKISLLSVIALLLILFTNANSDLSAGRYALEMDELIFFDGIHQILHPESVADFGKSIIGPDQRYGRIAWYLPAAFSAIPEALFGARGAIISTRLFFSFILLAATLLLIFTFLRESPFQGLALISIFLLPTMHYYATMPKPDQLQLFFFALYLHERVTKQHAYGWSWIYLGLAFGAKISALPFLVTVVALDGIMRQLSKLQIKNFVTTILSFLVGWIIAAPIVVIKFRDYLEGTFYNTAHGADDASVNALSWMKFIQSEMFVSPLVFWLFILLMGATVILPKIERSQNSEKMHQNVFQSWGLGQPSLQLFILGLALIAAITLKAHRMWAIYLNNGSVLVLIAMYSSFDKMKNLKWWGKGLQIALFLLSLSLLPITWKLYESSANRTQSQESQQQQQRFDAIMTILSTLPQAPKPYIVHYDPALYLADSTEQYKIIRFWGPYNQWDSEPDLVIVRSEYKIPPPTGNEYESMKAAVESRLSHTIKNSNNSCSMHPCYLLIKELEGFEIYQKQ